MYRRSSSPIVSRRFKRTDQPPEFLVKPRRICVELGQNAKFRIAFEGWPIPEVNWNHNGQCLSDDNKYKVYGICGHRCLFFKKHVSLIFTHDVFVDICMSFFAVTHMQNFHIVRSFIIS